MVQHHCFESRKSFNATQKIITDEQLNIKNGTATAEQYTLNNTCRKYYTVSLIKYNCIVGIISFVLIHFKEFL